MIKVNEDLRDILRPMTVLLGDRRVVAELSDQRYKKYAFAGKVNENLEDVLRPRKHENIKEDLKKIGFLEIYEWLMDTVPHVFEHIYHDESGSNDTLNVILDSTGEYSPVLLRIMKNDERYIVQGMNSVNVTDPVRCNDEEGVIEKLIEFFEL